MRPRIPEETEERIERLLDGSGHPNKAALVRFATLKYLDELEHGLD